MSKVSLFTHSFLDGYNRDLTRIFGGGLERYIYDLCGVLKEMGYRTQVHQLSFYEPFQRTFEHIDVYGHPFDLDRIGDAFHQMAEVAQGPIIYASCIWQPIRYKPGSLGICHGINWDRHDMRSEVKRSVAEIIQQAVRSLERIVTVDSHFQTYCRSVCTYDDAERIELIPNAVDTDYFVPASEVSGTHKLDLEEAGHGGREAIERAQTERVRVHKDAARAPETIRILYPRRLSLERGVILMMLVTDRLLAADPRVEVEFAGELVEGSPVGRTFRIWHRSHPHRDRIFQHTYDFAKVRDAYHQADIAVIPTLFSEGTSYACLEAMSCGLPVVSSNVGGLNDLIIDGFNGYLVTPTEDRLYTALRSLVEDPMLRRQLGKHARMTSLAFDKAQWKQRWRQVLEAYLSPKLENK
ncbi:glycosyltransferase [Paenibacillus sp. H1-7]|uniref:glycosyltransferase family 4 protein n=1 Tax=Paenibacillus sp. H1-7 TaxID=2282849 RepID=UPI001EF84180|nr:glycosyltransferase family 4 protein [Paenibacillus sp. H1-7]ULL13154.1 glycosyltransferase [Paenibacillus sp. H1-7]